MLGWKLFVRAVTLLIENLGDALRVSLLPYGVVIAISVWAAGTYGAGMVPGQEMTSEGAGATLLVSVLNLVATLWIAVAWHRYVLLGERPEGWLPPLRGGAVLAYLGRSVLIGLLVALIIMGVSIPLGLLVVVLPQAALLVGAIGFFIGMIVFYRLAVVLPAGAVDRPMSFGEAMAATRGHTDTVVMLALLTVGFTFLLQVPTLLEGDVGVISAVYQGVVGWIGLMVGVSTLTSLYGHLVEGRPVD